MVYLSIYPHNTGDCSQISMLTIINGIVIIIVRGGERHLKENIDDRKEIKMVKREKKYCLRLRGDFSRFQQAWCTLHGRLLILQRYNQMNTHTNIN